MLFTRTMYNNDATIRTSTSAQHTDVWVTQFNLTVATDAKVANPACKTLCYTAPPDCVPSDTGGIISAFKPSVGSPNPGVSANPNEAYFLHKSNKIQDFGVIASNNAIRFTAAANDTWVQMLAAGTNQALSASGSGRTVTVNLATNSSGAITSTGAQVIAAVNGSGSASALATAANTSTSTGAGIVAAVPLTEITRLLHGTNWIVNVGNAGAQAATLANMLAKNTAGQPFDGCFLDNLFTDLRGFAGCQEYSNAIGTFPNTWQQAYMSWLDTLVPQLHANGIGIVIGNISTTVISFLVTPGVYGSGSTVWNAYQGSADGIAAPTLERCDGAMFESWADGGSGPQQQQALSPAQSVYDNEIGCAKYSQANGKMFLGHSYLTRKLGPNGLTANAQSTTVVRRYALVEALIAGDPRQANGQVMVGLNAGTNDANPLWITEFDQALLLGAPSGAAVRDASGAYTRSFVNGSVIWNGSPATFSGVPAWDSSLTLSANPVPVNSVAPVVAGTTNVGDTLTVTNGTWSNSPTSFSYQWQRAGVNIGAATASTYQIVSADVGNAIRCNVTATNSGGASSPASSNAITIPIAAPVNTAAPVASGTLTVGSTVSVTNGTWTGSPTFTYQWKRSNTNIAAATAASYVLVSADVGTVVTCVVTGTNAGGAVPATSNGLSIPAGGGFPVNSVAPVVTGTTNIGDTLSCTTGTWTNSPTQFFYAWTRDSTVIGTSMPSTYQVQVADLGHTIYCTVSAQNATGSTAQISNGIVIPPGVVPSNTTPPFVSGQLYPGGILNGTTGVWAGVPAPTFTYQWQRDTGNGFIPIPGQNGPSYTVQRTDLGARLTLIVTATNVVSVSQAASNSLRLITRRILIDQNGQISDSEIPPPVLRDLNPTPVLIDTTGITNGQVLIYNAASNTMKPGAN